MAVPQGNSVYMTRRESAEYLGVSPDTVLRREKSGEITKYQIGGRNSPVRHLRSQIEGLPRPVAPAVEPVGQVPPSVALQLALIDDRFREQEQALSELRDEVAVLRSQAIAAPGAGV
jgi:excisionase family DNA binding protein